MDFNKLVKKYGLTKGTLVAFLIILGAAIYFLIISPALHSILCDDNVVNFISYTVIFFLGILFPKRIYEYLFNKSMVTLSILIILCSIIFVFCKSAILIFFQKKYGVKCKA